MSTVELSPEINRDNDYYLHDAIFQVSKDAFS